MHSAEEANFDCGLKRYASQKCGLLSAKFAQPCSISYHSKQAEDIADTRRLGTDFVCHTIVVQIFHLLFSGAMGNPLQRNNGHFVTLEMIGLMLNYLTSYNALTILPIIGKPEC